MWRDFALDSGSQRLVFSYPEPTAPRWTQLWRNIVQRVAIAPDSASKESLLDNFVNGHGVRTLGFVNAHAMNFCVADPKFAADVLDLDHIVRDGIGVHALYKLIGTHSGLNLNGTDLLPELIARYAGQRIALFGTRLEHVERAAERLRRDVGCDVIVADGFQRDGYYLECAAREQPALVVLGMGMPKQERVARLMKHGLHQDMAIACGGAILDFLSGHVSRAPGWMRRSGLEWMYRLSLEPKRLFGRYVIGNPLFLLRSAILSGRPPATPPAPRPLPVVRAEPEAYGIGGPLPLAAATSRAEPEWREPAPVLRAVEPRAAATVVPFAAARSEFSANRPVIERDDLFGRQRDLDQLLSWVLDQSGNALIYGPRGYGKTSLVRVFGEIADSKSHVVLYASCSSQTDFTQLMRSYISEIPDTPAAQPLPADGALTVQQVAGRLASVRDISLVIILDEFDRIGRDDTRESIVELIKDVSDLTASVRFVLVGVATDVVSILGYHPSVHRCLTCVPVARLGLDAVDTLFRHKAAADRLSVPDSLVDDIVRLTGGSAYHAQLIGQKLVARARRNQISEITFNELVAVIAEIIGDSALVDVGFAKLAAEMRDSAPLRGLLRELAQRALADTADRVLVDGHSIPGFDDRGEIFRSLIDGQILAPGETARSVRFANAFMPQLILMTDYLGDCEAVADAPVIAVAG